MFANVHASRAAPPWKSHVTMTRPVDQMSREHARTVAYGTSLYMWIASEEMTHVWPLHIVGVVVDVKCVVPRLLLRSHCTSLSAMSMKLVPGPRPGSETSICGNGLIYSHLTSVTTSVCSMCIHLLVICPC